MPNPSYVQHRVSFQIQRWCSTIYNYSIRKRWEEDYPEGHESYTYRLDERKKKKRKGLTNKLYLKRTNRLQMETNRRDNSYKGKLKGWRLWRNRYMSGLMETEILCRFKEQKQEILSNKQHRRTNSFNHHEKLYISSFQSSIFK